MKLFPFLFLFAKNQRHQHPPQRLKKSPSIPFTSISVTKKPSIADVILMNRSLSMYPPVDLNQPNTKSAASALSGNMWFRLHGSAKDWDVMKIPRILNSVKSHRERSFPVANAVRNQALTLDSCQHTMT